MFLAIDDALVWSTSEGPYELDQQDADALLDLYQRIGAKREFNDLIEAARKCSWWIDRPNAFRRAA